MQNLTLTWQSAGGTAVALYGGSYAASRWRRAPLSSLLREAGTLLALFALWQLVGHLSLMSSEHALDRARWIHRTELAVGLPDEASWQAAVTPYPVAVKAANYYYAVMHFAVMIAVLVWVFVRHRERYAWVRNTVVITTAICLAVQFIPVAPPRMLPQSGFVDVAAEYGQSVYGGAVGGVVVAAQLSAMPSVHVAWCVLAAVAVIRVSTSSLRWLTVLHPVLTVAVVVVTANHFWADGLVAVAILLFAYAAQAAFARWRARRASRAVSAAVDAPAAERAGSRR
ncbi:phosphatase PAP2 family protein [Streptomyces sp. CB01881]|uniref:phosphatase PAP2 family protein n=1 Tax=Streptomyces sp. CB01881 TaxID=2078691 RepID=UPI000CDCAED6|nr:phosphatase PAP2 family protein [Streptomyces sp. CB01881]AUY49644.1 inositol phosphorylceramide synthase [Streptomyces sp. CB01881]TYC73038.1 inositol phosphorylceramide synthase [Streptomyces sp. CB01881]